MFKIILVSAAFFTLAPAVIAADSSDTSTWVQFNSFTYTGKATASPVAKNQ